MSWQNIFNINDVLFNAACTRSTIDIDELEQVQNKYSIDTLSNMN